MPKWTNIYNLPTPLVALITEDLYEIKRKAQLEAYCKEKGLDIFTIRHFSASDLIKPPRMRVLSKRYRDSLVKDVSSEVYRLLGQAIHHMLREAAILGNLDKKGFQAEERLFAHFQVDGKTIVVSGEPDIVDPQHRIQDYKVTAVYSWVRGAKKEWSQQTNTYAWLRRMSKKLTTTGLDICFILRDWSIKEAATQADYPKAGAQMVELPMWTEEEQVAWVMERVRLHLAAEEVQYDEDLPECTGYESGEDNEMWEKPEAFAIKREGGKVASKVLTPKHASPLPGESMHDALAREAKAKVDAWNDKPAIKSGKEKPYFMEHRPGERTRCLLYCDAKAHCNLFKEYAAATFRGTGVDQTPAEMI